MSDLSHERVRAYLELGQASLARDEHLRDCAECRDYADHLARLQAVPGRCISSGMLSLFRS
jgi:predicted anti-sigma-YlaC factor YlaD